MKKINTFILMVLFLIAFTAHAQNPKGKTGTFALTHANLQTVTKGIIYDGTLILANGKITAIGTNIPIPSGAEVIDCKGQWIYPGMIDAGTKLGLVEVSAVARTVDTNEIGDIVPQMKSLTAVNPNSALIPVTRVSGVTTVITSPDGGLFPGTAALIHLYGYTPDQMYAGFEAVVLNFPNSGRRGSYDHRTDEEIKSSFDKVMNKLNDTWEKAEQYHKLDSATGGKGLAYYPEMTALLPVVRGQQTIIIEVNAAKDILAALQWVKEKKIKKSVLSGVMEGWRVAKEIASAGIPVLAGPVLAQPTREYDRYDRAYANPGLLQKAGVKVAIQSQLIENVRNLPYHAAFAATYGMGKEEALRAVTIVPAEIFGVANKLGSLEVGKNATLFVCDGDPFETKTNITQLYINGWQIPVVSRHTQLYDEFLKREPGLEKKE